MNFLAEFISRIDLLFSCSVTVFRLLIICCGSSNFLTNFFSLEFLFYFFIFLYDVFFCKFRHFKQLLVNILLQIFYWIILCSNVKWLPRSVFLKYLSKSNFRHNRSMNLNHCSFVLLFICAILRKNYLMAKNETSQKNSFSHGHFMKQ